jgi:hypothetical protein
MEMHMVHWKLAYKSPIEAVKHRDGLAVLAVVFSASAAFKDYPWLQVEMILKKDVINQC